MFYIIAYDITRFKNYEFNIIFCVPPIANLKIIKFNYNKKFRNNNISKILL